MADMTGAEQVRVFHLSDVLSITTGRCVSIRGVEGIYDILDFMTGDTLFTHQLQRAVKKCKPALLEQFPRLCDANALGVNEKTLDGWLAEQIARFGEKFLVRSLMAGRHEHRDLVQEAVEMTVGADKVVVVINDEDEVPDPANRPN